MKLPKEVCRVISVFNEQEARNVFALTIVQTDTVVVAVDLNREICASVASVQEAHDFFELGETMESRREQQLDTAVEAHNNLMSVCAEQREALEAALRFMQETKCPESVLLALDRALRHPDGAGWISPEEFRLRATKLQLEAYDRGRAEPQRITPDPTPRVLRSLIDRVEAARPTLTTSRKTND